MSASLLRLARFRCFTCFTCFTRFMRQTRGSVAVEAALVLPILLGVGLLGADMQRIHTERIRLENAAGSMAQNLAAQSELSRAGLDALARIAMQGFAQDQLLIVLGVEADGKLAWALQRGEASGLCEAPAAGGRYSGTLPTSDADAQDGSARALIVVRACRDTRAVALHANLVLPAVIETQSVFPASHSPITLDAALKAESVASGLAASDS